MSIVRIGGLMHVLHRTGRVLDLDRRVVNRESLGQHSGSGPQNGLRVLTLESHEVDAQTVATAAQGPDV